MGQAYLLTHGVAPGPHRLCPSTHPVSRAPMAIFIIRRLHSTVRFFISRSLNMALIKSNFASASIWCTQTLSPLYTVLPHGESGDIFSLIYVHTPTQQRLIFGCQNTSIQWVDLSPSTLEPPSNSCQPGVGDISPAGSVYGSFSSNTGADNGMPNRDTPGAQTPFSSSTPPKHKFFDSFPQPAGRPTAPQRPSTAVLTTSSKLSLQRSSTPIATPEIKKPTNGDGANTTEPTDKNEDDPRVLAVPLEHVVSSAHYGYIYCMALVRDESGDQVRLVTGSGDEETKVCLTALLLTRTYS
jgi:di- and tripeptidase